MELQAAREGIGIARMTDNRNAPLPVLGLLLAFLFPHVAHSHSERDPDIRPLIPAAQVRAMRTTPGGERPVFIDVRSIRAYKAGHVPGALHLSIEASFEPVGDRSRIVAPETFRRLFSRLGIKNSDYVIIYDDGRLLNAAHLFWVMEVYAHEKVSVMDGGLAAWLQAGGKLETRWAARSRSVYVPGMSPHHLSTRLTTRLALDNPDVVIVDSRSPRQYRGLESRARRAGHIPGAINIPAERNIEIEDGAPRVKPQGELQSLYRALGKKRHIIAYCNRGKESALTYLVLRNMGYSVSVYDGAWLEWGNDAVLPIEKD